MYSLCNYLATKHLTANWASRIRTVVCSSQSAVPYRLAIAQDCKSLTLYSAVAITKVVPDLHYVLVRTK